MMEPGDKAAVASLRGTPAASTSSSSSSSSSSSKKPEDADKGRTKAIKPAQPESGLSANDLQLEQSMRDSEEALRDVTRTIRQSWSENSVSETSSSSSRRNSSSSISSSHHDPTYAATAHGRSRMQPSASTSSNLVQKLLTELDQVFTTAFAEDELGSMQKSITASEGTVAVSGDVSNDVTLQAHFTKQPPQQQQHQQQHQQLQQQQPSDTTNQAEARARIVPLAELEEFSEENGGTLTEDDTASNRPSEPCECGADADSVTGDSAESVHAHSRMNGPLLAEHIVDVNGNGTSKHRACRHSEIRSYQDLLDTFMDRYGDGDEEEEEDEDEDEEAQEGGCNLDFLEFAEKYFNVHCYNTGYTGAFSKTVNIVRRKNLSEVIPIEDLIRYTKTSTIPTSHIHMLNPDDASAACSIFKDLCKYLKGETKGECGPQFLTSVIKQGQERYELRDEVYCQLIRQSNNNPSVDSCHRVWGVMCLCSASFSPSASLKKYLMCYLRQQERQALTTGDAKISDSAAYCLRHLATGFYCRKLPPCQAEIEAVSVLQPMVLRTHLMDGKTKALVLDPLDTGSTMLLKVQDKMGLHSMYGWALYEVTPERDRHISEDEYLADVLSEWETEGKKTSRNVLSSLLLRSYRKTRGLQVSSGTPKKASPKHSTMVEAVDYGKVLLCKRIFHLLGEGPHDPVDIKLQYAQAVHCNINDEYSVAVAQAFHLAGLQAQVEYGDFEEDKMYRYGDVDEYICKRVLASDRKRDWSIDLAAAHKRYGRGRSEENAMLKYLSLLSQCPLYGCSKIFAHYRGLWPYGIETVLAINFEGIKFISIQEKVVAFDFYYAEIEQIILEEQHDEYYVIIQLKNYVAPHRQKCFMFECLELDQLAYLIECYSPHHGALLKSSTRWRVKKFKPSNDWLRLYGEILGCRTAMVESGFVVKPGAGMGLIRSAWNRLSGRNSSLERMNEEVDTQSAYWTFSRVPFKLSIMVFDCHEMTDVAARMFNSTLVYTGIESAAVLDDMDLIVVVQTLIIKCMENENLCNEFYLQLIKQTTDTQTELAQKAGIRYWHLMTMATCVMLPPSQPVFQYLNLHLKRYAMSSNTEEGQYALFCIKSVCRTFESKGRKYPPSVKEIEFVTKTQPIEVRIQLADAHQMLVEFDSSTTAAEIMQIVKAKAGMRLDAEGYTLFEMYPDKDNYVLPDTKIADAMYRWELAFKHEPGPPKDLKFLFQKRLFVDSMINLCDPVEIDLLYHQSVTDVFEQKIPLTRADATELCALRAQTEYGDYGHATHFDYTSVMRILPRHLRDLLHIADIAGVHKRLSGTAPVSANIAFLEVLKQWPLYGATVFDVTQTGIEKLPRALWLAVSQIGIHLMEYRGQDIYFTYPYKVLIDYSATSRNISITVVGALTDELSLVFVTPLASQIVQLITDYVECLKARKAKVKDKCQAKVSRSKESLQKDGVT